jgi:ribosomal protein L11 methyltransferase
LKYPALDVDGVDGDFLLALVDDFNPSAADTDRSPVTIFFPDGQRRDLANAAIVRAFPDAIVSVRDVDDEDWARRSQEDLKAITVGRITIAPPLAVSAGPDPEPVTAGCFTIVIAPSMGFGTGHHATTRLCVQALQQLDLRGAVVIDAGTGSGVLAIAARLLGAADVLGIDDDRDAIQAASENLERNSAVTHVRFEVGDLRTVPLPKADVITANLTGALLVRIADLLLRTTKPGGSIIVSGLQTHEHDDVVRAFAKARVVWQQTEDEWVGIVFRNLTLGVHHNNVQNVSKR